MKKVFILNGSGGVGKDTFVDMVGEIIPSKHISIIDPVKSVALQLGWFYDKSERGRKFLSDLKDVVDSYNDFNMNYARKEILGFIHGKYYAEFLFIDMRDPEQIKTILNQFPDSQTVLVTNNSVKPIMSNHSDANVLDMKYDYTITNNGTMNDLRESAREFVWAVCEQKKGNEQ